LIAHASPIFQVMHSIGGKYKNKGYTISFLQEVVNLDMRLPRHIQDLDLIIVVRKDKVLCELNCNIKNDPYYHGVQVDENALKEFPEIATNVSHLIKCVTFLEIDNDIEFSIFKGVP